MKAGSLIAALLIAGCFDPQIPQGLACEESGECPPGQSCDPIDSVCREDILPDAGGDRSDDDVDPEADAGTDDPPGEFGEPVRIAELSSATSADDDPSLTSDELELYFNRSGDIYVARRSSRMTVWGAPQLVTALNSTSEDDTPSVARDGLTIWFSSNRDGLERLYFATRSDRQHPWAPPVMIGELDNGTRTASASVTADGKTMTFLRDEGGLDYVPYQTLRPGSNWTWGTPVPLGEIDSPGRDALTISPDGLTAILSSDRHGSPGALRELYITTRASRGAPFSPPESLDVINSAGDDTDPWLSDDGRRLYFKTDTAGGSADLYVSTR